MWLFEYNVDMVNLQKWRDCSIDYVENAKFFYKGPKERLWENSQNMVLTDKMCVMYMCVFWNKETSK